MDVPFHGWVDVELQICSALVKITQGQRFQNNISALLKEGLSIRDSAVEALVSTLPFIIVIKTVQCAVCE